MRNILLLLLCVLPMAGDAKRWTPTIYARPPVTFSDDFTTTPFTSRAGYLTTNQFTFNADHVSGPGSGAMYFNTTLNTQNQYIKWLPISNNYGGCVFRATTNGADGYFVLDFNGGTVALQQWNGSGWNGTRETLGIVNISGDTLGATIVGVGAATRVRLWINPVGNAPDAGGLTWGGVAPTLQSSVDPVGYFTGSLVGLAGSSGGEDDNVFAGDVP